MPSESSRMAVLCSPPHSNAVGQRQEITKLFWLPETKLVLLRAQVHSSCLLCLLQSSYKCQRIGMEASPPFHGRKRSYRKHAQLGNYRLGFCAFCFQWEIDERWDIFSPNQLLLWYPSTHWGTSFLPLPRGVPCSLAPPRKSSATSPALHHQTLQMSALPQPKVPDAPELSSVPPQTNVPCTDPARSSGLCHHEPRSREKSKLGLTLGEEISSKGQLDLWRGDQVRAGVGVNGIVSTQCGIPLGSECPAQSTWGSPSHPIPTDEFSCSSCPRGRTCCYVTVCLRLTSDHTDTWTKNAVSTVTSGPMTGCRGLVQQHP